MIHRTTKVHLQDLLRNLQAAIKKHLYDGRFHCADELKNELAWLARQLGLPTA